MTILQGAVPVREIIVHCTATRPDFMQGRTASDKVAEVRRWHLERGFSGIGYHWLIDRDGTVAKGRPMTSVGAHVIGHNTGTIGVSLFGGFGSAATDRFAEHFTAAQDAALRRLIADIKAQTTIERITGHNQYAAKACPGFNVAHWLAEKPVQAPVAVPATPTAPKPAPAVPAWLAALRRWFGG